MTQPNNPYQQQPPYAQQQYGQPQQQQPYGQPQQQYGQPYGGGGYPQPGGYPPAPYGPTSQMVLADWGIRVGAYLIDMALYLVGFIVVIGIVFLGAVTRSGLITGLLSLAGYAGLVAFGIWNQCYRLGTTGQSLGKQWVGIKIVGMETGAPIGFGSAFVRQLCHILDGFFCIGYLFPLWDERKQTFADKICNTLSVRV